MSLAEKLTEMREAAAKNFPPQVAEIMHRATDDLVKGGAVDRVIKVGSTLPSFTLTNQDGAAVESADLLARGPLMLTIYRGSW